MILIEIENFHINIIDNRVCLRSTAFEFGVIIKKIEYAPTDDHFTEAFV